MLKHKDTPKETQGHKQNCTNKSQIIAITITMRHACNNSHCPICQPVTFHTGDNVAKSVTADAFHCCKLVGANFMRHLLQLKQDQDTH